MWWNSQGHVSNCFLAISVRSATSKSKMPFLNPISRSILISSLFFSFSWLSFKIASYRRNGTFVFESLNVFSFRFHMVTSLSFRSKDSVKSLSKSCRLFHVWFNNKSGLLRESVVDPDVFWCLVS